MQKNKFIIVFYIILGSISLVLGLIGIFLPLLPTTPFLLLSGFFYLRSSNKLYHWLTHHGIFGAYIYDYMTYKAVARSTKRFALIFLWITLTISCLWLHQLWTTLLLITIGSLVSLHILKLNTMTDKLRQEKKDITAITTNFDETI